MAKIITNMMNKIKEYYDNSFGEGREIYEVYEDECEEQNFFEKLFEKVRNYKQNKNKNIVKEDERNNRLYLNRNQAIIITCLDKNLKRSMYNEAVDNGFNYGIIEFKDFYTTLVKYNNELYWYVKVLDGKYGFKEEGRFKRGYFDEYSNIRCLINATTGKYIYINKNFNTEKIRMISDEEFLNIIFKFK